MYTFEGRHKAVIPIFLDRFWACIDGYSAESLRFGSGILLLNLIARTTGLSDSDGVIARSTSSSSFNIPKYSAASLLNLFCVIIICFLLAKIFSERGSLYVV